jgi:molybdopterin synthase sulfur carrier subunit
VIRVELPAHLRRLAAISGDVVVRVEEPVTIGAVLSAIEIEYPVLRGTIRDAQTRKRRPYVRYYAAGEDLSFAPEEGTLPRDVLEGQSPFVVLGAISGG